MPEMGGVRVLHKLVNWLIVAHDHKFAQNTIHPGKAADKYHLTIG